ncbi:xanthine dehydrogenase [Aureococcus anophagefferens]|nr:xanthine dehydrogenase [Aureococcus anophagefferens]
MAMTGGREATACDYEVSFDAATGALASYAATFAVEGGHATQDAAGDLSMAVQWSDNCYDSGRHDAKGKVLKTRAPRSSSMRSPGVIQSQCCRELAIVRVAHETRRPVHEVQELNFYKVGQKFPYGSKPLGSPTFNYTIPELYAALKPKLLARLDAVDQFNEANAWRKRGVHVMPTKYIMAMDFWKVPALVNVYGDGSVQVAHGGCELGQGIHTKVAAVAAYALGCDLSLVTVADTSTDKTPNSVATGGSGTSESCCGATLKACATLKKRLAPYVAKHAKWADAVAAALADAVELSATGWNDLRTSESGDDPDYATYGLALAEVEVDCLSGEVEVREVDVRMDQGSSLNSDVDVGQVEGAIVMALGFYLTEHCAVDARLDDAGLVFA